MYMIMTDLSHILFLKPGYTRQLKHEKTILWSTVVDISVLRVNVYHNIHLTCVGLSNRN